jgi:hypothetical protein
MKMISIIDFDGWVLRCDPPKGGMDSEAVFLVMCDPSMNEL